MCSPIYPSIWVYFQISNTHIRAFDWHCPLLLSASVCLITKTYTSRFKRLPTAEMGYLENTYSAQVGLGQILPTWVEITQTWHNPTCTTWNSSSAPPKTPLFTTSPFRGSARLPVVAVLVVYCLAFLNSTPC